MSSGKRAAKTGRLFFAGTLNYRKSILNTGKSA
jgi:hypothetical protein